MSAGSEQTDSIQRYCWPIFEIKPFEFITVLSASSEGLGAVSLFLKKKYYICEVD